MFKRGNVIFCLSRISVIRVAAILEEVSTETQQPTTIESIKTTTGNFYTNYRPLQIQSRFYGARI